MNEVINSIIIGLNGIGRGFWEYAASLFVQSSGLIVLLLIVDFLLRKRVRAVFRYCVWMLVFVKLVLPTSFALPTGIGYWLGDYWSSEPSIEKAMPGIETALPVVVPPEPTMLGEVEVIASEPPVGEIVPLETVGTMARGSSESAKTRLKPIRWQGLVFLGWLAGMLVLSVLLVQRAWFVRGLLAQAKEADGRLLDLLGRCHGDVGLRGEVGLKVSENMSSPAVCGVFAPTILLPRYLVDKLSEEKLRAILIHECAHIRRWDMWVNLVQTVLQIIYFYHPFVWLANARVRRVREEAVDEMVMVVLGGRTESYSNALIDIGEMAFWQQDFSLRLIGVVESKKALAARIRHIASRPTPKTAKLGVLGLIAVVIIGAVMLPMARAQKRDVRSEGDEEIKGLYDVAADVEKRAPTPVVAAEPLTKSKNETMTSGRGASDESRGLVVTRKVRVEGVRGYSGAMLGEWNGDGKPDMFLISDGKLLVVGGDGALLQQAMIGGASLDLLADADDDGKDELFVSWSQGANLNIAVLDQGMNEVKRFKTTGCVHPGHERSTFRGLALVDLDSDGRKELLAKVETGYCLKPRGVYCFDAQSGQLLWNRLIAPSPMPPLVTLDVNGDGKLDVVFGSYSPGTGSSQDDGTDDMHCYVHAVSHKGEVLWIRELGGHYTATYPVGGDVDGDGNEDIIVRIQGNPDFRSEIGKIVRLDDKGNVAASFDAGATLYSCSVEDLEPDGKAEVIATDCRGFIYVLNGDLEVLRKRQLGTTKYESIIPVTSGIADIDRDGAKEIVLTYAEREFVSGRNPRTDGGPRNVRYYHNNCVLALDPALAEIGRHLVADEWRQHPGFSVIVCDLDTDGTLEILSLTDEATVLQLR